MNRCSVYFDNPYYFTNNHLFYVQGFYSDKEDTSLEKIFAKHHNVFQDDGNAGLIDQVTAASQKAKIKRLTKVFITLSLQDVADR